ncbi:hypothetical protein [Euzebyella saccharophila]|nr:hypothetical protein [Euzebyella saccharophila]
MKKTKTIDAVLIGFLVGIIAWSVFKNSWGLVTLIPLVLIFRLIKKSEK